MKILLYADGACSNNQNPDKRSAGCAYILLTYLKNGNFYYASGGEHLGGVTNQVAELTAVLSALKTIHNPGASTVRIVTDSAYVVNIFSTWLAKWEVNGWKNSSGEPVKNLQLIQELTRLVRQFSYVEFKHTKGHDTDALNNVTDAIAQAYSLNRQPTLPKDVEKLLNVSKHAEFLKS